jgi:cytosolic phospholipase A2
MYNRQFSSSMLILLTATSLHAVCINKDRIKIPPHRPTKCTPAGASTSVRINVREGNELCAKEIDAINTRSTIVRQTLQKFTGQSLDNQPLPSIGIVTSGGSCRAAIASIGLLRGLEKIGLLNAAMYLSSLSGSTWSVASWYVNNTMDLEQFTQYLKLRMKGGIGTSNIDEAAILNSIAKKLKSHWSFSLNDIWGALIADLFLRTTANTGQDLLLSELQPQTLNGSYPIPLFTSVIGQTTPNYQWAEFSPFEIGSTYLKTWIPSSAFGKSFSKGVSNDGTTEESLGFMLGLFGSAYAANVGDIVQAIKETLIAEYGDPDTGSLFFGCFRGKEIRIFPPTIPNFVYKMSNVPLAKEETLSFIDGGFAFNLPFPPLFRRNVSLYIVCDASSDATSAAGSDLREVENWAKQNGYALPSIDYKKLASTPLSVWTDVNNPEIPVIIFVPCFETFSSGKFSYSNEEFDKVVSGIEKAVTDNVAAIKQAVELALSNAAKQK